MFAALIVFGTACDTSAPSTSAVRSFVQVDVISPDDYPFYGALATGDVDGDGDPDLLVSGVNRELGQDRAFEQRVFLNDEGRFRAAALLPEDLARRAGRSQLGDYDGDGDADILFGSLDSGPSVVRVYPSLGARFGTGIDIASERTSLLRWLDIDGDGDLDVATIDRANCETGLAIYRNDRGAFTALAPVPGAGLGFLEPGDVDGDGDLDLIAGGYESGCNFPSPGVTTLFRNERGTFVASDLGLEPITGSRTIAWLDADGDGDQDLLYTGSCVEVGGGCAATFDEVTALYRNDGGRLTRTPLDLGRITGVRGVAVADYDGDGDDDFAAFGVTAGGEYVAGIYTSGSDGFAEVETGLTGVKDGGLAWADYDGDGNLDLLVSGSGNTNVVGDGFITVLRQVLGSEET
ncbi:FG-GAP-like repeat-containing protein [Rubrivirga sp.]|uniref:FG-GAP-like repeat-containing protein n=1 Tax=Rubrivirga sp. TaxID=1885344 RepID=UPI003B52FA2C